MSLRSGVTGGVWSGSARCGLLACLVGLGAGLTGGGCSKNKESPSAPAVTATKLPDLPSPDITGLEPVVRTQVEEAQAELAKNPTDPGPNGRLAMLYHVYHLEDAADAMYQRAGALDLTTDRWHYLRGRMRQVGRKLDEAIEAYRTAVKVDPKSVRAWIALGSALVEKKDHEAARSAVSEALKLDSDLPIANYLMGKVLLASGQAEEALAHLKRASAKAPDAGEVHRVMAEAYDKLGDAARAAKERIQGCGPRPIPPVRDDEIITLVQLGRGSEYDVFRAQQSLQAGRVEEAISLANAVLEASPKSIIAYDFKAGALLRTGRMDEAIAVLRKANEVLPGDTTVLSKLAVALAAAGQFEESKAMCAQALTLDPKCLEAHAGLGELLRREGKFEESSEHLTKALELSPERLELRYALGQNLQQQGKEDEALEEFRRVIAQEPSHAAAHFAIGVLLDRRGETAAALDAFRCTLAANPTVAPAYAALVREVLKDRQFGQADKLLQEATQNIPDSPEINNNLAWLRATCPDALYRNGAEAVRLGLKACELTQFHRREFVDTLAAAYAEAGDFQNAVKYQQQAIEGVKAAGGTPDRAMFDRLDLYRAGKPYRDTAAGEAASSAPASGAS